MPKIPIYFSKPLSELYLNNIYAYPSNTPMCDERRGNLMQAGSGTEYFNHECFRTKGHKGKHECMCGYRWRRRSL